MKQTESREMQSRSHFDSVLGNLPDIVEDELVGEVRALQSVVIGIETVEDVLTSQDAKVKSAKDGINWSGQINPKLTTHFSLPW